MKAILGTAGHIDHGKTALVGALTGVDTDRLPEEKRRGISIDLGFTHLSLGDVQLGIVDVPGHEDFIRNMLAGATGIDLLLLVVAADEGVMPQTREHVAIAELLGVPAAVVALTKADLVEPEWLDLVRLEVQEFLEGTAFSGSPTVETSTLTGQGLDELRARIGEALGAARRRPDDLFRLPVDRAFTVRGTGTVLTGTVWSGRIERDQRAVLLPGGLEVRIRGLQVHGEDRSTVEAGERAAVALAGVDRDRVGRGMALVTDPAWQPTRMLTARIRILPGAGWSMEPWQRVHLHLGTAEVMARTVLLGGEAGLPPGAEGWVQLRLEEELVARAGDRFVVRSWSPVTTIGGGTVVEPVAPKRSRVDARTAQRLAIVADGAAEGAAWALLEAADEAGLDAADLPITTGGRPDQLAAVRAGAHAAGNRLFHPETASRWRTRLTSLLDAYHRARPLESGMPAEALRREGGEADPGLIQGIVDDMLRQGDVVSRDGRLARPGWTPVLTEEEDALRARIAKDLAAFGIGAPRIDELAARLGSPPSVPELLALLEGEGQLVRLEADLYVDAGALGEAVEAIRGQLSGRTGLSPGDFRDVVDVSRRHLMPLLAFLDREGVTVRDDSGRTVAP